MATTPLITADELADAMYGARLVDCTDDDRDGTPDDDIVTGLRTRASSWLVTAAIKAGYTLPLDANRLTELAKHHLCFKAAWMAALRRPQFRDKNGVFPYDAEAKAADAWREEVKEGRELLYADTVTPAPPTGGRAAVASRPRRGWGG